VGDSLIAPSPATTGMIRSELISQYSQIKAEYMRTHEGGKKRKLEEEIDELKIQIRLITNGSTQAPAGFDWAVEFAEVFADGGFDIQVANPPYVRQELIKDLKPTLQKIYPATYNGTSDLYCFFYARALQLLKVGGMLAFISSNKWFRAKYGDKLKKQIADNCQVHSITDFGDLPVFQSAAVLVMIFLGQKESKTSNTPSIFTKVTSLKPPYPDVREIIRETGYILSDDSLKGSNWKLTNTISANLIHKMELAGVPLGEYINSKICWGIKTGFNKAFIIDDLKRAELITNDSKSAEIIKPLAIGDDVRKWRIEYKKRWLILTSIGVDIKRYPAVFAHLKQWQPELDKRSDKGKHWWELRACDYYNAFNQPKIVYPEICKESRFSIDYDGLLFNNKAFILPLEDLYLLGLLNSSYVWEYLRTLCSELLGKSIELRSIYMNTIPIPNASTTEREAISKLVQKCLDAKGVDCEAWEKEIDDRVAALYGL
jgi:hypothetical protein